MSEAPRNGIENINRYVPGMRAQNSDHGFERIVILLLGLARHGKSSLINSFVCVVKNDTYSNVAGAGEDDGGRTTKRTKYDVTDKICITDNRGFKTMAPREILEVCAQLRHLRLDGAIEWEKDNLKETVRCIPQVNKRPKEFLVPVIVHSCLLDFKKAEERGMTALIRKCQEINKISPIVVITNVGPPNARSENAAIRENKFKMMGCNRTICLENYTDITNDRSEEADRHFISFLNVCIDEAERGIQLRGRIDYLEVFANSVADQIKEENEVKEMEMERKLKQKDKKVRELEQRPWHQNCPIL